MPIYKPVTQLLPLKDIHRYLTKDEILKIVSQETGKDTKEIKEEKGTLRQVVMEVLYRFGGLKGEEIGRIMEVGYTSVSQERRRLRERLQKDRDIELLLKRIEKRMS